jgi:RNA polymerase sigma-70 factor (ECF subfamily)
MNPVDADDVRRIVHRVRNGDRDAYGAIVTLFEHRLMSLAAMMVRDVSAAEDIAQEAFVRAYLNLERYDDQRPIYPWLARIAVRLSQNWLVRRQRSRIDDGAEPEIHAADPQGVDPEQALILDEASKLMWCAVAALPQGERTAILLCYRQDMSVSEAARTLDVTNGTVKTWLFRARRKLQIELTHAGIDDSNALEKEI